MASSILSENANAGTYNTTLADLVANRSGNVDCVVIAPPEDRMVARIERAMGDESFVHLPVQQSVWCDHKYELLEAIRGILENGTCSQVMIVGHSMPGLSDAAPSVAASDDEREVSGQSGFSHIANSLYQAKVERMRALQHTQELAQCFQRSELFSAGDGSSENTDSGQPILNAYFYMAEAGVFRKVHCASGDLVQDTQETSVWS
ncbi:MAG: hypothetical protein ACE361_27325 [Aureliella sp.]